MPHCNYHPTPTHTGFSPNILGKPADWGRWIHVTGFWVTPILAGRMRP